MCFPGVLVYCKIVVPNTFEIMTFMKKLIFLFVALMSSACIQAALDMIESDEPTVLNLETKIHDIPLAEILDRGSSTPEMNQLALDVRVFMVRRGTRSLEYKGTLKDYQWRHVPFWNEKLVELGVHIEEKTIFYCPKVNAIVYNAKDISSCDLFYSLD